MPVEEDAPSAEDTGKYNRLPVPLVTECRTHAVVCRITSNEPARFGMTVWRAMLLERFPAAKRVFVEFHVDALAAKLYSLDAEAKALFGGGFTS